MKKDARLAETASGCVAHGEAVYRLPLFYVGSLYAAEPGVEVVAAEATWTWIMSFLTAYTTRSRIE